MPPRIVGNRLSSSKSSSWSTHALASLCQNSLACQVLSFKDIKGLGDSSVVDWLPFMLKALLRDKLRSS